MMILVGGVSEGLIPFSAILVVMVDSIFKRIRLERRSTNSLRSSRTSLLSLAISCTFRSALWELAIMTIASSVQKTGRGENLQEFHNSGEQGKSL